MVAQMPMITKKKGRVVGLLGRALLPPFITSMCFLGSGSLFASFASSI
jgi:hypothetical protein